VPGRDAYPADVFNVHASLLERAGKTKLDLKSNLTRTRIIGHGSITALPIIETINCDVTEFIATNLISITDGQIYTRSNLFRNGYRPAVDSAISVSRVGSNAQPKYVRQLVRSIKNELTNYRRWFESAHIADQDEQTEDVQLLRLKGRSIECMY
jgi:F-type H+-transporting ATPase subunit alpha